MSNLYKPLQIGDVIVTNRIAMAPLTRLRASQDRVPTALMKDYYAQRASVPGTLIISEGTFISTNCGGFDFAPGIWSDEQVAAWKTITEEVHRKGSFIFSQLFAMGRAADADIAKKEGVDVVAPSAIPIAQGSIVPRAMTVEEVKQTIRDFVHAATNAMRAGFDGVEIHGANGYLLDQFIQDVSNARRDEYGGSVEKRSRLLIDVLQAVSEAIGPQRVGVRLSPWSTFQGMKMQDPIPQFSDIVVKASRANIAYLHVVESRISGAQETQGFKATETLDFAYKLWDGPLLVAGGYTPAEARKLVDEKYPNKDIVVVFGRYFLSNPDLVFRMHKNLELNKYQRNTFYVSESPVGYVDYPFSNEYLAEQARA